MFIEEFGRLEMLLNSLFMKTHSVDAEVNRFNQYLIPTVFDVNADLTPRLPNLVKELGLPDEGIAQSFARTGRLDRLPDGEYDVLFDGFKIEDLEIPEQTVTVSAKRAYHPSAQSFDHKKLLSSDRYRYDVDDDVFGTIVKLVNLKVESREISSLYTDLQFQITIPFNWSEVAERYLLFHSKTVLPHISEMRWFSESQKKIGVKFEKIVQKVFEKNKVFYRKHYAEFQRIENSRYSVAIIHNHIISKFINAYKLKTDGFPSVQKYKKGMDICFDGHERVFTSLGSALARPIVLDDLRSNNLEYERHAFNELFKQELQEDFLKKNREYKAYESKGLSVLVDAFDAFSNGFYSSAVIKASTALEIVLKGYLNEFIPEAKSRIEKQTLHTLITHYFDSAVRKDPEYDGLNTKYVFPRRITEKIFQIRSAKDKSPKFHDIRCSEVHDGGTETLHAQFKEIGAVGFLAYYEAIRFIVDKGWKDNNPYYGSELLLTSFNYLENNLPKVDGRKVDEMVDRQIGSLLKYLTPEHIEFLNTLVPENSHTHDLFTKYDIKI